MPDQMKEMVRISREIMCSIWERFQRGLTLPEEEHIAGALREHDEYKSAWEAGSAAPDEHCTVNGANPFLHVHIHVAVENQLRGGDPPGVSVVLGELQRKGIDRHEAIHMIGSVLINEIYEIMGAHRPFDRARYLKGLDNLLHRDQN